jgi:hypothetical protein
MIKKWRPSLLPDREYQPEEFEILRKRSLTKWPKSRSVKPSLDFKARKLLFSVLKLSFPRNSPNATRKRLRDMRSIGADHCRLMLRLVARRSMLKDRPAKDAELIALVKAKKRLSAVILSQIARMKDRLKGPRESKKSNPRLCVTLT